MEMNQGVLSHFMNWKGWYTCTIYSCYAAWRVQCSPYEHTIVNLASARTHVFKDICTKFSDIDFFLRLLPP